MKSRVNAKMASRVSSAREMIEEDPMESEGRREANFLKVEAKLFEELTKAGVSSVGPTALMKIPGVIADWGFSWLGAYNPMVKNASTSVNDVWILDNTGYQTKDSTEWQAEVVACFFQRGRGDLTKAVAAIADAIGLDGKAGDNQASRKLIEYRIRPFVHAVAPARTLPVVINTKGGEPLKYLLGPSDTSGIAVQTLEVGQPDQRNGTANEIETDPDVPSVPVAKGVTRLAVPQGFGVISDIDDTIKITQVSLKFSAVGYKANFIGRHLILLAY